MKEHRLTEEYTKAFRAFLDHTSEKKDLLATLKRRIEAAGVSSLLDIGAGNGDLAIPLSKLVNVYLAIEPKPDFAAKLKASGITVINSAFPCEVEGMFDAVLASHVVPWEEGESIAFFREAWKHLNPGGRFIMITYDEEVSEWGELLQASGLPISTVGQGHLEGYKRLLGSWGMLEVEPITTHVETESLDDMLLALSFVYGDGKPEDAELFQHNEVVRETLESRYRANGHYYHFPFTHYLLQAEKIR
jgi:SAM-dependent methyltransferase